MEFKGYLTVEGDSTFNKWEPRVVVYAMAKPGEPWLNCNPADLVGAPESFKVKAHESHKAEFHRQYWMLDPSQLRISTSVVDGKRCLVLSAYNIPNVDPVVGMRRLNNIALAFSQQAGFTRWCVVLKHQTEDPFEKELPSGGYLPDPSVKPLLTIASEQDLRNISCNGQA